MAKISKADIVDKVADSAEVSKADAERVLDSFFDAASSAMRAGDEVSWPKFGKFSQSQRKARIGRNPATGEPVNIAAARAPKFTAAAALKSEVNS